jgi:ubiquinone/menaquinone biosynthesis C-methylase UbiE
MNHIRCIDSVTNNVLKTYGQRTFSYAAAKQWNDLPNDIKKSKTVNEFKKKIKNYLFKSFRIYKIYIYFL